MREMIKKVATKLFVRAHLSFVYAVHRGFKRHSSTRAEIMEHVKSVLSQKQGNQTTCVFIGTGQYFEHKTDDRVIVLAADFSGHKSRIWSVCEIIDTGMKATDVGPLTHDLALYSSQAVIYQGELDCVNNLPWKFGYSILPHFSLFSKQDLICTLSHSEHKTFINIFSEQSSKSVCLSDISHVQLRVSAEPWLGRCMELELKSGESLKLIDDFKQEGSKDLCDLMMSTEWLVKAAGQICVVARQQPDCHISLRLPRELMGDFNEWVSLRNSLWAVESTKP